MGIERVYNHAIGSSGLCTKTPNNLVELLEKDGVIHPEAELILIWHGSNDWYWGAPIGDKDSGTDTYLGALYHVVARLRERCPMANIVWLTPVFRLEKPDGMPQIGEAYVTQNRAGITQRDIHRALEEASLALCFSLVDMRRATNFHLHNHEAYTEDGIHPNARGYRKISEILLCALDSISFA